MIIALIVIAIIAFIKIRPYFYRYDTVIGFTGGLGSGKTFESVNVAIRELKKNRLKTNIYNIIARIFGRERLERPLLYSSIPVRVSKHEYSEILTAQQLLLQENINRGSIVFIDEVDVWANQFAHANPNVIEILSKRDIGKPTEFDEGIFDEHMRLFRHYHSSPCCEPKLVVNTQATGNIITIIRRRINTVYYQSQFRIYRLPILCLLPIVRNFARVYYYRVREIAISDDIVNTSDNNLTDNTRIRFGFCPVTRHYDTHCYSSRVKDIPISKSHVWHCLKTNRLLKCPLNGHKSKCNNIDD